MRITALAAISILCSTALVAQPARFDPVQIMEVDSATDEALYLIGPAVLYSALGEYQGILRARFNLESGTCVLAVETEQGGPSKWTLCAVEFDEDTWTHRRLPRLVRDCRRAKIDERLRFTWHAPDRFGCRIAEFREIEDRGNCTPQEPCPR